MTGKTIAQVIYEKAQDELHQDYFADVRRVISAFRGNTLTEQTHAALQIELNYSYAKFAVLNQQPMARLVLDKYEAGEDFNITIHWPPSLWGDQRTEVIPT